MSAVPRSSEALLWGGCQVPSGARPRAHVPVRRTRRAPRRRRLYRWAALVAAACVLAGVWVAVGGTRREVPAAARALRAASSSPAPARSGQTPPPANTSIAAALASAIASPTSPYFPEYGDVVFVGAQTGWLDGYDCGVPGCPGFVLRTTDGGSTWAETVLPSMAASRMTFLNADDGWLSGTMPVPAACALQGGRCTADWALMATTDGGRTWQVVDRASTALTDIQFVTPTVGFAATVGREACPALVRTTDGGHSWSPVPGAPSPLAMDFVSAGQGWLVARSCTFQPPGLQPGGPPTGPVGIFETTDGGSIWSQQLSTGVGDPGATSIDMLNPRDGWVTMLDMPYCAMGGCKGDMYRTTDGGHQWTLIQSASAPWHVTPTGRGGGGGFMAGAQFLTPSDGWLELTGGAATSGGVGVTTNGGTSWNFAASASPWWPWALAPVSMTAAWAIGAPTNGGGPTQAAFLARTVDGGREWLAETPTIPTGGG